MSSLPEEIYLEILVRLPVKSLLACKCVCKSWLSWISDPDFVKRHLNLTTQTNKYRLMLESDDGNGFYSVCYDDSLSSSNTSDDVVVGLSIDFPSKSLEDTQYIELYGSCNGLVYGWNAWLQLFFLWNPTTKEYMKLPKSDAYGGEPYHGFCFDYKANDYKLVRIDGNRNSSLVQMYSLKSNSWKRCQSIGHDPYHYSRFHDYGLSGVFCNGSLHWLVPILNIFFSKVLVSMDIKEERFEELQLPTTPYCVLDTENSTKLYTITFETMMCNSISRDDVKIKGSLSNGEILFMNWVMDKTILYDPKNRTAREFNICRLATRESGVSYLESLVSLNSNPATARKRKTREITS